MITTHGVRAAADNAALDSLLVHARCLINFCCGNYTGAQHAEDIQPADFLGHPWWPDDEELDRRLRGRLRFINQELQHLSWQRVRNEDALIVSVHLLAHEVHVAMRLFVNELRSSESPWLERFEREEPLIASRLPKLDHPRQTVPHLAPARRGTTTPP